MNTTPASGDDTALLTYSFYEKEYGTGECVAEDGIDDDEPQKEGVIFRDDLDPEELLLHPPLYETYSEVRSKYLEVSAIGLKEALVIYCKEKFSNSALLTVRNLEQYSLSYGYDWKHGIFYSHHGCDGSDIELTIDEVFEMFRQPELPDNL